VVKRFLIVNYLPQNLTEKALYNLFAPLGPLESVKLMRDRKTGYSFGFGFVNYMEEEHAMKAIELLNGFELENKRIKVSIAMPSSEFIKGSNLYISNLPRDTTCEDLEKLFSPFGKIVHRTVLVDKITNLPRGVGFVRFAKRESAHAALKEMNNVIPPGGTEPIRVKIAEDYGKQKASYVAGFQAGANLHKKMHTHSHRSD
jgi:protein sex-lethal